MCTCNVYLSFCQEYYGEDSMTQQPLVHFDHQAFLHNRMRKVRVTQPQPPTPSPSIDQGLMAQVDGKDGSETCGEELPAFVSATSLSLRPQILPSRTYHNLPEPSRTF